ncbi:MAG TPA: DUF3800 domain-containing protein [Chlamydiales bacterium]|nr:DUF3800 domain-containing protein [Chlamydiales bacterium]
MHLYFIDDSGDPSRSTIHFVLGGVIIPGDQWHKLNDSFSFACEKFKVEGEIKWRLFGRKPGDGANSISHLSFAERDNLRKFLFESLVKFNSVKIIASVVHLPTLYSKYPLITPEDVYSMAYKPLTERFQYCLQDLSRASGTTFNGILVCDHRNPRQDKLLRNFHQDLLKSNVDITSKYSNLIETLFLAPSHQSIGLQFSDLVVGAILRFFENGDEKWYRVLEKSIRRHPLSGKVDGYGLLRIPNETWIENDAESRTDLEPAILTQSQRKPDYM